MNIPINNHRVAINFQFHFPWVSLSFPEKIYAFCFQLHMNYYTIISDDLSKVLASKK